MEIPGLNLGSRRNEDIALDLMKFIAGVTQSGKGSPTAGFSGTIEKKPEEQVSQLLELYSRCLDTVNDKK